MSEIKTKQTNADIHDFINTFANTAQKKKDSYELIKLMQKLTGEEPKMWGPSIIGFGKYHYKSPKGTQEGEMPLLGFSPRKAAISLYVYSGDPKHAYLLEGLGNYKIGKACIYVKRLADINQEVLINLMKTSIDYTHAKYGKM